MYLNAQNEKLYFDCVLSTLLSEVTEIEDTVLLLQLATAPSFFTKLLYLVYKASFKILHFHFGDMDEVIKWA